MLAIVAEVLGMCLCKVMVMDPMNKYISQAKLIDDPQDRVWAGQLRRHKLDECNLPPLYMHVHL
jgi:hypothetical protein